ncbi:unnamed protein product [Camellia sinensis]
MSLEMEIKLQTVQGPIPLLYFLEMDSLVPPNGDADSPNTLGSVLQDRAGYMWRGSAACAKMAQALASLMQKEIDGFTPQINRKNALARLILML